MKKILFPLMMPVLLAAPALAQITSPDGQPPRPPAAAQEPVYKSLEIGAQLPNQGALMMGTVPGQVMTLGQAKTEKGLLVMFSCNTCPYVVKGQQRTREAMLLAKTLGIGMVVINSNEAKRGDDDSPDAMMRYATTQEYTMPYLRDDGSMMANIFGATRTPEIFLFNGEGILVYKGAMEDNPGDPAKSKKFYLNAALKALAANKTITPAETKSIGCSIKRMH